ncbi:hypothetical protein FBQ85_21465, partial [Cytophagia bacterium CHB2]|nr:hypothetical protein [Cytophagia bacterium CHB2]
MKQRTLFSLLPSGLEATLHEDNPWWRGERIFGLPEARRWAFTPVLDGVKSGATPITVLRGPRPVGEAVALRSAAEDD